MVQLLWKTLNPSFPFVPGPRQSLIYLLSLNICPFLDIPYEIRASLVAQMVKESACNAGSAKDSGSILGSGRFPQRRKLQPTPVFLPGKFHGQRSLVGYSPQGPKEVDMTERLILSLSNFPYRNLHKQSSSQGHCLAGFQRNSYPLISWESLHLPSFSQLFWQPISNFVHLLEDWIKGHFLWVGFSGQLPQQIKPQVLDQLKVDSFLHQPLGVIERRKDWEKGREGRSGEREEKGERREGRREGGR